VLATTCKDGEPQVLAAAGRRLHDDASNNEGEAAAATAGLRAAMALVAALDDGGWPGECIDAVSLVLRRSGFTIFAVAEVNVPARVDGVMLCTDSAVTASALAGGGGRPRSGDGALVDGAIRLDELARRVRVDVVVVKAHQVTAKSVLSKANELADACANRARALAEPTEGWVAVTAVLVRATGVGREWGRRAAGQLEDDHRRAQLVSTLKNLSSCRLIFGSPSEPPTASLAVARRTLARVDTEARVQGTSRLSVEMARRMMFGRVGWPVRQRRCECGDAQPTAEHLLSGCNDRAALRLGRHNGVLKLLIESASVGRAGWKRAIRREPRPWPECIVEAVRATARAAAGDGSRSAHTLPDAVVYDVEEVAGAVRRVRVFVIDVVICAPNRVARAAGDKQHRYEPLLPTVCDELRRYAGGRASVTAVVVPIVIVSLGLVPTRTVDALVPMVGQKRAATILTQAAVLVLRYGAMMLQQQHSQVVVRSHEESDREQVEAAAMRRSMSGSSICRGTGGATFPRRGQG
jgi:hypothetical protein